MIEVVGIDHVQLSMPPGGEDEARRFYVEILGLREVAKPPELAGRGGCWFVGGDAAIHLAPEAGFRPHAKAHPALVIRDLARAREALAAAGVAIEEDDSRAPGQPLLHPRPVRQPDRARRRARCRVQPG